MLIDAKMFQFSVLPNAVATCPQKPEATINASREKNPRNDNGSKTQEKKKAEKQAIPRSVQL